jgi:hypothetical protein
MTDSPTNEELFATVRKWLRAGWCSDDKEMYEEPEQSLSILERRMADSCLREWQPISTAPKDGSWFIDNHFRKIRWCKSSNCFTKMRKADVNAQDNPCVKMATFQWWLPFSALPEAPTLGEASAKLVEKIKEGGK